MGGDGRSRDPLDDSKAGRQHDPELPAQPDEPGEETFAGLLSAVPAPKPVRPDEGRRRRPGVGGPVVPGTLVPRQVTPPPPVAPPRAGPAAPLPEPPPAPAFVEPELMLDEPPPHTLALPVFDDENPLGDTGTLPAPSLDLSGPVVFDEPAHVAEPVAPGETFEEIVGPGPGEGVEGEPWQAPPAGRKKGLLLGVLALLVVVGLGGAFLLRDRVAGVLGLGPTEDASVGGMPATTPEPQPVQEEPTQAPAVVEPTATTSEPALSATTPTASPDESPMVAPVEPIPPGPASRVLAVSWHRDGNLALVIRANGSLTPSRVRTLRLESPPREVVNIAGIMAAFDQETVKGDGTLVTRVRLGHHPETSPPELRLVLDLAAPSTQVTAVDVSGASVRLTLAGSGR